MSLGEVASTETQAAPTPAPSAPVAPTTTETPSPEWVSSLTPELQKDPTLGRYKTVSDLARGFLETKKLASQKSLVIPPADAPPEAWGELNKALGVPESPAEYDLEGFEAPQGWDPEFQNAALEAFHGARIPSGAAKQVLSWYAGKLAEQRAALQTQDSERVKEYAQQVQQAWGADAEKNLDLAMRGWKAVFGEHASAIAAAKLEGGGMVGDHPAILAWAAAEGKKMAEDQLVGGKQPAGFTNSVDAAKSEIQTMLADPDFRQAWTDVGHKDHKAAMARWTKAHETAYGGAPASASASV